MTERKRVSGVSEDAGHAKKSKPSFSLEETEKNVNELSQGRKYEEDSQTDEGIIEEVIKEITRVVSASSGQGGIEADELEVEIRLGSKPYESNFRSGVYHEDFSAIEQYLGKNFPPPTVVEEVDYIYQDHRRVTWDISHSRVIRACKKRSIKNKEIPCPTLVYDLRIGIASEQVIPCKLLGAEQDYHTRRHKKRITFTCEYWKVELTVVKQLDQREFEIELELDKSVIQNIKDRELAQGILAQCLAEARNLISILEVPDEKTFTEIELEKLSNHKEIGDLKNALMTCLALENKTNGRSFPGSMPINFSRKHIPFVQAKSSDYFVSEKTDGIRYIFMVTPRGAYFVDRKYDFYKIKDYDLLIELYASKGITILDGELIRNLTTKRPVFMIFDALQLNGGESVCKQKLTKRLEVIKAAVSLFGNATFNWTPDDVDKLPFSIIGKRFEPKARINALYEFIRTTPIGHEYCDEKRHHFTDGLIFTPNTEYSTFTSSYIFKWKYLEKLTVDFRIRFRNQKIILACVGVNEIDVECKEVRFSESDSKILWRDFARSRDQSNVIVECAYDVSSGRWKYHGVRRDKNKPNFIQTVFDTMESIAENITVEELRFRIAVPPESDDYESRMKAARETILKMLQPPSLK